jgi:hypothetical protein
MIPMTKSIASRKRCILLLCVTACGCTPNAPAPDAARPTAGAAPVQPEEPPVEQGFQRLTIADFEPFQGSSDTWREEGNLLSTTGQPKGYLHSRRPYRNFTWRLEFRHVPASGVTDPSELDKQNTGFMIHIQEPHKVWPRSLEVQGKQAELCSIKGNGGVPDLVIEDDPAARDFARSPVGEWNSVEIVSLDGTLSATLNGTPICTSAAGELTEGLIGLQSELFEVQFRNLRIREE